MSSFIGELEKNVQFPFCSFYSTRGLTFKLSDIVKRVKMKVKAK